VQAGTEALEQERRHLAHKNEPLDQYTNLSDYSINSQPAWSPDGTKIVYARNVLGEGQSDIFTMSAVDGSNKVNLTDTSGESEVDPSWQPVP
jgi:Tol biopolymer transport system component